MPEGPEKTSLRLNPCLGLFFLRLGLPSFSSFEPSQVHHLHLPKPQLPLQAGPLAMTDISSYSVLRLEPRLHWCPFASASGGASGAISLERFVPTDCACVARGHRPTFGVGTGASSMSQVTTTHSCKMGGLGIRDPILPSLWPRLLPRDGSTSRQPFGLLAVTTQTLS